LLTAFFILRAIRFIFKIRLVLQIFFEKRIIKEYGSNKKMKQIGRKIQRQNKNPGNYLEHPVFEGTSSKKHLSRVSRVIRNSVFACIDYNVALKTSGSLITLYNPPIPVKQFLDFYCDKEFNQTEILMKRS
jgi:hypothetical protein